MAAVFEFMEAQPLFTLALLIGVGSIIGRISIRGISLGPAAVLFTAIGLTAWADSTGARLELPEVVGYLGLTVFAFCVGLLSGPGFFRSLRRSWVTMVAVALIVVLTSVVGRLMGEIFGLSGDLVAGTFAGAVTNTPALAAAGGSPEATIGYASAYLFGVVGALVVTSFALKFPDRDRSAGEILLDRTIRVDREEPFTVDELMSRYPDRLLVTRIRRTEDGPALAVSPDTELHHNDVLTVVGPQSVVERVIEELGHRSSHDLRHDRAHVDFRRIILSSSTYAGRRVADLRLEEDFGARAVRIRRGDVDFLATPDTPLQLGDRLRVVGPPAAMREITRRLGDSTRGLTALVPVALGIGLALGIALGAVQVSLPGGATFSLGAAGGTLIVGLILGRIGRIGPVTTSLPATSATVLSEYGLIVFLAFAGTKAGTLIGSAIASGQVLQLLALGAVMTLVMMVGTLLVMGFVFRVGGTTLSGMIGGAQTNPAILAFASSRTSFDARVPLGYALLYPAAMIAKIVVVQLMGLI